MKRTNVSAVVVLFALWGCTKDNAADEARKEAEELSKRESSDARPAAVVRPPISNEGKIPCEQLIDLVAFQTALGEKDAMTVAAAGEVDAAASCDIKRGGKPLTKKEQDALSKKKGLRLGVLPGDAMCRINAYCWTVETPETFQERCKQRGLQDDTSMGNYACLRVIAQGADDVHVYRFLDEDTKCVLQASGGPSNVNNDSILTCAKTARDTINPDRIKVDAAPPPQ